MADFAGSKGGDLLGRGQVANVVTAAKTRDGSVSDPSDTCRIFAILQTDVAFEDAIAKAHPITEHNCFEDVGTGPGLHWFELIHCTPAEIELGNLVTTTVREIEVYNAFRWTAKEFTSATNNAGSGITFEGLATLPYQLKAQASEVFDVEASMIGPPTIDGTLDFVVGGENISVPITGSRVVMFAYQPEKGIMERLEWRTNILRSADGTEQRVSVRKNPRQSFAMTVRIPEGEDRRKMQTLLKGWHPRVFGVPIWWEAVPLTADAASAQDTVSCDTRYGDYRVGSLAVVWQGPDDFDALQIASLTDSSITFESNLTMSYDADEALVMPLRTAYLGGQIDTERYLNALQDFKLSFEVIDNDVDLADTADWNTYKSKVVLDDPNYSPGPAIDDNLLRELQIIDNGIGQPIHFSTQLSDVPLTQKGFVCNSMSETWKVRQLAHALRGSQISFYLPTFYRDLVVNDTLTAFSDRMDIDAIGYSDYIQGTEPFLSIWIELTDGTILMRDIEGWEALDATTERLTVDTEWDYDITPAEIERVSLLRLVRIADDVVEFMHDYPGSSKVKMNVRGAP